MPVAGCSKEYILNLFRDNDVQAITAESMRVYVNCVYDNFIAIDSIVDDLNIYDRQSPLSANQGALLNDRVQTLESNVQDLESNKADATSVYTKTESDTRYYEKTIIDSNFYDKTETYSKNEIDAALISIQNLIQQLDDRIDNIVYKNNLVE